MSFTPQQIHALQSLAMRGARGFRAWAKNMVSIKDKLTNQILPWGPRFNPLQERVCDVVEWCLANNQPIRIITVKYRQGGSSTVFVNLLKWLCEITANAVGIIVGAQFANVESLWDYLKTSCQSDRFNWGHDRPRVGRGEVRFGNGALIRGETAKDKDASVGWDCRFMLLTECALWAEEGIANARDMLLHALSSVAEIPGTAIILESTGRGPAGVFWERGKSAVWLHEMQANPELHRGKYIKVFAGWHEAGALCRVSLTEAQKAALEADLTARERRLRERLNLDLEQLAWRRDTIENKCDGVEEKFCQEFPSTWEEAFMASSPSIFAKEGLEVLRSHVDMDHGKWEPGLWNFNPATNGVSWQHADPRNAMWRRCEAPLPGKRYLMGVDFASGKTDTAKASSAAAKNYDHHRASILRCGFWDESGHWQKPRIVAHTVWPCQWDPDLLENELWWAHLHYGRCFIVPERNRDDGITRNLVNRGAHVFAPTLEQDVSTGLREARSSPYYGFTTTGGGAEAIASKRSLVRGLIQAIREFDKPGSGIVVDERTLYELQIFIRHTDGSFGAINGEHDDAVMALAFCLACMDMATLYHPDPYTSPMAYYDPASRPFQNGNFGCSGGAGV